MKLPEADWIRYINRLAKVDKLAADKMREWIAKNGTDNVEALISYAYSVSTVFGEAAAAISAEMYDATAQASGVSLPPAEPAPTASFEEVQHTVQGVKAQSDNIDLLANSVSRLVKRASADTTLKNAERDGAQFAWVPHGDTCSFCLTLASRGWQYMSKKAMKNGHAIHIHANCDCTYATRHDNETTVGGYNPDIYKKMYDSAEGRTPQEKINAMRRAQYEANKDKINAQKRATYAERRKQADDVTREWKENAKKNQPKVIENPKGVTINGKVYYLEENHVFIDHDDDEKATARLLSKATGKRVTLCPRITGKYKYVSTPDYLVGSTQEKWDRKGVGGSGKDALRDVIKKKNKKKQADYYIIDISKWKGTEDDIVKQAVTLFQRSNMRSIKGIALIKGEEIIKALMRKK